MFKSGQIKCKQLFRELWIVYLDVFGAELILLIEIHVAEVFLADGFGQRQQFAIHFRHDGQQAGQLIDETVVVAAAVHRIERHWRRKQANKTQSPVIIQPHQTHQIAITGLSLPCPSTRPSSVYGQKCTELPILRNSGRFSRGGNPGTVKLERYLHR